MQPHQSEAAQLRLMRKRHEGLELLPGQLPDEALNQQFDEAG